MIPFSSLLQACAAPAVPSCDKTVGQNELGPSDDQQSFKRPKSVPGKVKARKVHEPSARLWGFPICPMLVEAILLLSSHVRLEGLYLSDPFRAQMKRCL